jgi:hypothetical protein
MTRRIPEHHSTKPALRLRSAIVLGLLAALAVACGDDGGDKKFRFSTMAGASCSNYFGGDVPENVQKQTSSFNSRPKPCPKESVLGSCLSPDHNVYGTDQVAYMYEGFGLSKEDIPDLEQDCEEGIGGTWYDFYFVP